MKEITLTLGERAEISQVFGGAVTIDPTYQWKPTDSEVTLPLQSTTVVKGLRTPTGFIVVDAHYNNNPR